MPNPFSGKNSSGFRFRFNARSISNHPLYLPIEMKSLPQIQQLLQGSSPLEVFNCNSKEYALAAFNDLRKQYDFDFWAATEYFIRDINDPDSIIPLILNGSQLHVIDIMRKRLSQHKTGRYIITKSDRRIGLSTCIQAYILWLQTFQRSNNSYTCGPSSISIHPLKSNLCRYLKRDIIPSDMSIFLPRVGWCAYFNTFHSPDAIRGVNLGFVHFSDMSRWPDPSSKIARRAYIAPVSAVLLDYFTLVVLEGDIPKRKSFNLKDFLRQYPRETNPIRKKKLSSRFKNPLFINHLLYSLSSQSPYYHHIHCPHLPAPSAPPLPLRETILNSKFKIQNYE